MIFLDPEDISVLAEWGRDGLLYHAPLPNRSFAREEAVSAGRLTRCLINFLLNLVSDQLCFLWPTVQESQYIAWWLYGPSYRRQMCLSISFSFPKLF